MTRGAEILEILHGLPQIKNFLFSLYECRYADFFKSLGNQSIYQSKSSFDYYSIEFDSKFNSKFNLKFQLLKAYVEQYMKKDRYFAPHYQYYVREMRIIAYNQLLESYSSLALSYMANSFGVSNQFIDK